MATERHKAPGFIVHALHLFIHVVDHVLPSVLARSKLLSLAWLHKHCQSYLFSFLKKGVYNFVIIRMFFQPL
jgi:hypothetical protein